MRVPVVVNTGLATVVSTVTLPASAGVTDVNEASLRVACALHWVPAVMATIPLLCGTHPVSLSG